jgi:hypothetical protein
MKRTSLPRTGFLLGVSLFTFVLVVNAQDVQVPIVSDTSWTVIDANGNSLGNAQIVCLNATSPPNCPANAMQYGYPGNAWTANLSNLPPGAVWIWVPGITGTTAGAANADFFLQHPLLFCGPPQDTTIFVAADNFAEVFVNNRSVVKSTDWSTLSSGTVLGSSLVSSPGVNSITVHIKNDADPGDCTSDQYKCNPAGVVLGAAFSDTLNKWPTCTGNQTQPNDIGQVFQVGQTQPIACTQGQSGFQFQACGCVAVAGQSFGTWSPTQGMCVTPTCTNPTGNVGDVQTSQCTPPQTGTETRTCQATSNTASWGNWDTSKCVTPPVCTDTTTGATFNVGQTEPLACTAPLVGSATRTCLATGNTASWGTVDTSGCALSPTCKNCKCGGIYENPQISFSCPSGTACQTRRSRSGQNAPPWCIFALWIPPECHDPVTILDSTDWFCD